MQGGGPISKTLSAVSALAKGASLIPQISAEADAVSWATSILAKTAKAFGWSKPIAAVTTVQDLETPGANQANWDGPSNHRVLAGDSRNALVPWPLAGTDDDELALDKVLTAYFNWTSFSWSNQASGNNIYDLNVVPSAFTNSYTDTAFTTYRTAGMVSYLAYLFSQCRGSIKVRLRAYKTKWHSGSLFVVFLPGYIGAAPTITQSQYANRVLWDLQKSDTLEVVLPYTSQNMYSYCSDSLGRLDIYVCNPLTASSAVPASINISVDIACEHGYEFAGPMGQSTLITPYSVQAAGEEKEEEFEYIPIRRKGKEPEKTQLTSIKASTLPTSK